MELKHYQAQALQALEAFAQSAALAGARQAFLQHTGLPYGAEPFGEVPCVCLRIPTGGGKTLLAAHALGALQRAWPSVANAPLALWLVPSDAIRSQTLAALATAGHPFRNALAQACGDDVRVCSLEEVATLGPQDFNARAVVVVATMQSFRVEDTDQRNVYAFSEALEPHFRSVAPQELQALHALPDAVVTEADLAATGEHGAPKAGRELLRRYLGQPRYSLANWLALRQPYVIVDEAHNTKTERSFEALKRLNPAFILELTATPLAHKSNVLFHVSAQQLQAEAMIKMPIALAEHTRGWKDAVLAAVQTQRSLEAEALQEEAATGQYIRPIVLLQAQNSTEPVNVEVLRTHLVDELHIPADQVKVATGTQRELEGLDLNARGCVVRYIITVQALREGWDCPFAYVLCSVQTVRSATAIEQLLGRVLRMPYAQRRTREALNKAYAHVTESETGLAANALADRLIDGMGFDPLDMASMLAPQLPLPLQGGGPRDDGPLFATPAAPAWAPSLSVDLPAAKPLPEVVQAAVQAGTARVSSDGERQRVVLHGAVHDELADALVQAQPKKLREQVQGQVQRHNALVAAATAPVSRGEVFAPVPRLCYRPPGTPAQQPLALLEREAVLEAVELNLLAQPIALPGLHMAEQATNWELYLDGQRTRVRPSEGTQLALDAVGSSFTEEDLARWLAAELQHPSRKVAQDIVPSHLRAFALACVRHLVHEQHFPLPHLGRHQYTLVRVLAEQIEARRDEALKQGFHQWVLQGQWEVAASAEHSFRFEPGRYPVPGNRRYSGRHDFPKHFYPVLHDLKDGGEEFQCAVAIDRHPKVARWVRNLDSDPVHGFWLPTSFGRFYPDFVCELKDGRLLVVEYKGQHIQGMPREIEKAQVGKLWAQRSGGLGVFKMVFRDDAGRGPGQQLDDALA